VSPSDLLPPAELTPEQAENVLRGALRLTPADVGESTLSYFDSFDGRVRAAGLLVAYETAVDGDRPGRLVLFERDTGFESAAVPAPAPSAPVFAGELHPGPLRERLEGILEERSLLPLVRVQTRVRGFGVLDSEG
jgi:hypothetical protein